MLLLAACVKDPEPKGGEPDPPPATSITVITKEGTALIGDVFVGIADTKDNRDLNVFLYQGISDARGEIVFENMPLGTYYLSATRSDLVNAQEQRDIIFLDSVPHLTVYTYF